MSRRPSSDLFPSGVGRRVCRLSGHDWSLLGTNHDNINKNPGEAWCYRCNKDISDRELAEYMLEQVSAWGYVTSNAAYCSGLPELYVRGVAGVPAEDGGGGES